MAGKNDAQGTAITVESKAWKDSMKQLEKQPRIGTTGACKPGRSAGKN